MQHAAPLLALPRETLLQALACGGPLVSVDATIICRALRDLFAHDPNEKERLRVQAMCTAMAEHSEDLAVQLTSCIALGNARVWDSPSSRRYALDAGAIRLIVAAMRPHAVTDTDESLFMAYNACWTLHRTFLCSSVRDGENGATRELLNRMADEGVIEATVAALETFNVPSSRSDVALQDLGLEVLHLVCSTHARFQPCDGRVLRAVRAGAIEVGVAALAFQDADVRLNACWMLANVCSAFAQAENASERAVAAGAVEPLIDAIRTLDVNQEAGTEGREAIRALLNISVNSNASLIEIIREQIVAAGGQGRLQSLARNENDTALRLCWHLHFVVDDDDDGDVTVNPYFGDD